MKLFCGVMALACVPAAVGGNNVPYPKEKVAEFVVEKLDVTTLPWSHTETTTLTVASGSAYSSRRRRPCVLAKASGSGCSCVVMRMFFLPVR